MPVGRASWGSEADGVRFRKLTDEEESKLDSAAKERKVPLSVGDKSLRAHLDHGSLWARNRAELA